MIFFDKTRTIGQDANGKNVVWVSIYVDTAANLPAYNDYQSDGFILCMASEGRCIDTGDLYRLDSAGAWQISQAGTGTYTKSEIDTLLTAKQDVLTFDNTPTQDSANPVTSGGIWADQQRQDVLQNEDRAALVELVDSGAKNIADISKTTFTSNTKDGVTVTRTNETFTITGTGGTSTNNFFNVYYSPNEIFIPSGTWTFYLEGTGLNDIRLEVSDDVSQDVQKGSYGENPYICTVPDGITRSHFRICTRAGASFTGTSFKIMICSTAAWKISQSFQPYRPSWQDMYDMILALQ